MIRITVELDQYGLGEHTEILGTAQINNIGTGTPTSGNYRYTIWGKGGREIARGEINNFPRKRLLAWDLLLRVLLDALGERNRPKRQAPAGTAKVKQEGGNE